jgi:hypothetical protein
MFEPMLLLLLILAGAYAWQNALRARARARAVFDLCMQANATARPDRRLQRCA